MENNCGSNSLWILVISDPNVLRIFTACSLPVRSGFGETWTRLSTLTKDVLLTDFNLTWVSVHYYSIHCFQDQKIRRRRVCEKLAMVPGKLDHASIVAYQVRLLTVWSESRSSGRFPYLMLESDTYFEISCFNHMVRCYVFYSDARLTVINMDLLRDQWLHQVPGTGIHSRGTDGSY